jgi:tetratricopeptide (TPR) repeat protein
MEMIGEPSMRQHTYGRAAFLCCLPLAILAGSTGRWAPGTSAVRIRSKASAGGQCPTLDGNWHYFAPIVGTGARLETFQDRTHNGVAAPAVPCSSAVDCINEAEQLFDGGAGDRAKAPLERAIALDKGNSRAYRDLALVYMRWYDPSSQVGGLSRGPSEEECRQADSACRTALALAPDDTQALLLLGEITNRLIERRGFSGDESAIEPLKQAIEINPDCPDPYSELGHGYTLVKQYDEAVAAYTTAVALRRGLESLDTDRYSAQRQREQQITDALAIVDLCGKTGKHNLALEPLQEAEKSLAPVDYRSELVHFALGKTYLVLGDIESAKREKELVAQACAAENKFVVYRCEAAVKDLQEAIDKSR